MENKNWIQEMIERESLPKASRAGTVDDFCAEYGISQATYYYQASKKENERQIIRNAVKLARKGLPEVLEKLREKAESGDSKSTEMFLKYVAELSEHLDLTTGGEPLYLPSEIIDKYDKPTRSTEEDSNE